MFVVEVRQTFLNFLKPYLIDLPDYFNDVSNLNDQEIVFNKYFQKQEYLASFEDEFQYNFAKDLLKSSQLQAFCDESFLQD